MSKEEHRLAFTKKINSLLKIPLKRHQIFAIAYALPRLWSINGYKMGLGKSAVAVALSLYTKSKTVIVCPAFLKINWSREFEKFSKRELKVKVLYSKEIEKFEPTDEDVIILNYELAPRSEKFFKWAEFICCDESHYLGSPSTQRTKAVFNFCIKTGPKYILLMSGSPIRGRVPQWYVPIKLIGYNPAGTSGKQFEKRYTAFQEKFCLSRMVEVGSRQFRKFYGLQNVDELKTLLKDKLLRRCPNYELELPKLSFQDVEVDYKIEDRELQELFLEYEENKKLSDHLASAKKSNAIAKVPFTYKFAKNIIDSGEGPIVIYSDHVQPLHDLSELFNKKKISDTIITGTVPIDKRQKYIDAFQNGETDVFLATIGAASTGITLTISNKLIFNDKSWINTENEQALKRIHRISQGRDCIIYSILSGKVDKLIYKIIREKDLVMQKTVDF